MDKYILSYSDWEQQKEEELERAFAFSRDMLKSPLTKEEFSKVWYSEHSDKRGKYHLANMCMSIFQSRKSRAGRSFELAVASKYKELGIKTYEQVWVDCDGNVAEKKPTKSSHKIDTLIPTNCASRMLCDMILVSKKTTLRERYRQDLDFVGKCKKVIFLTKEIPDKAKIDTIAGYGCILVYPNAEDSDTCWSYEKYFSELKKFQNL